MVIFATVAAVLAAAERDYEGSRGSSIEEINYGLFRDMGPDDTVVNLPGGEDARDQYRLNKIRGRHASKGGLNQPRRRRSAADGDSDDQF